MNTLSITDNTVYGDRPGGATLLHVKHATSQTVRGNVLIGDLSDPGGDNVRHRSRKVAGVEPYPQVPDRTF